MPDTQGNSLEPNEVQVRKVGETVYGTVSSLATALEFPITILKDSARPDYWVPDQEITSCAVCDKDIGVPAPGTQVAIMYYIWYSAQTSSLWFRSSSFLRLFQLTD